VVRILLVIVVSALLVVPDVWSGQDAVTEQPHRWLSSFSLVSGYGVAPLKNKHADYEVIPVLPQFGFDIKPLTEKMHVRPKGLLEFVVEPLVNLVINPDTNAEVGCSLFLRYSDKITARIAPYIEGGVGMIYTTQHTHEQGTQYNFISQAGIGIQFFLNKHVALTGGYRFRHLSNADLDKQNQGIDHHFGLVGVRYYLH